MTSGQALLLSATDVARAIDDSALIDAVADALRETSSGDAQVPPRIKMSLAGGPNRLIVMPAYLDRSRSLVTKAVAVFPGNRERGLPLINGLVVLHDGDTGLPVAIMDGAAVTDRRTAAASAVAARALANPAPAVLAVIGAGAQARAHVALLAHVYSFAEVRICAAHPESAERLVRELGDRIPARVRALADAREAVRDAAVVVTATTSTEPVLQGAWLDPGAHVCAIGAATPTHREVDSELVERAAVIAVESREAALAEAGDLAIPLSQGLLAAERVVELGEILLGRTRGRERPSDVTVYKGVGTAATCAAAASAIHRGALARGIGARFAFDE